MDASTLPKGQSLESTDGRPKSEPGTYKHKETGEIFITAEGEAGSIQADAILDSQKWGGSWERVGDVPSRVELLKMRKAQDTNEAKVEKKAKTEANPAPGTGETYDPSK